MDTLMSIVIKELYLFLEVLLRPNSTHIKDIPIVIWVYCLLIFATSSMNDIFYQWMYAKHLPHDRCIIICILYNNTNLDTYSNTEMQQYIAKTSWYFKMCANV